MGTWGAHAWIHNVMMLSIAFSFTLYFTLHFKITLPHLFSCQKTIPRPSFKTKTETLGIKTKTLVFKTKTETLGIKTKTKTKTSVFKTKTETLGIKTKTKTLVFKTKTETLGIKTKTSVFKTKTKTFKIRSRGVWRPKPKPRELHIWLLHAAKAAQ